VTTPQGRERLLRIALLVTVGVSLLAALAALERYRFASEGLQLGAVSPERFDALGHRRGIVDLLLALTVAASAVIWLAWLARVYANRRAVGASWGVPPLLVWAWVGVVLLTLLVGGMAEKVAHRTLQQLGPVRSGAPLEVVAAVLVGVSALLTARLAAALTSRQETSAAQVTPGAEDVAP
jgi:hypothetical protein